jgi:hypothetical protein
VVKRSGAPVMLRIPLGRTTMACLDRKGSKEYIERHNGGNIPNRHVFFLLAASILSYFCDKRGQVAIPSSKGLYKLS